MLADWEAEDAVIAGELEAVDCGVVGGSVYFADGEVLEGVGVEDFLDFYLKFVSECGIREVC